MPESVPMHYNSAGQVDRFGSNIEFILIGFLFSATAVIMSIAFDRIRMVEYGKLIGFICTIFMEIVFIGITIHFVSKIFESSGQITLTNGEEKVSLACAIVGAVLLIFGSIECFIFRRTSSTNSNLTEIMLPIISSICGSLTMLFCLLVKNYYSFLILAIGLAISIISTVSILVKNRNQIKQD